MREIPLTQGFIALVDDCDYEMLMRYSWHVVKKDNNLVYAVTVITVDGRPKALRMHRLIMNAQKGENIDHIDHSGVNNQRCNLRFCSVTENHANQRPMSHGTSLLKGVSYETASRKWRARVMCTGIAFHLGRFDRELDAYAAYCRKAPELFGSFAYCPEPGTVAQPMRAATFKIADKIRKITAPRVSQSTPAHTLYQDVLVDTRGASNLLKIPETTLNKMRLTGENSLTYIKIGRLIRYRTTDLRRYLEQSFNVEKLQPVVTGKRI